MHLMKYFAQSNRLVLNGAKGGSVEDIQVYTQVYHGLSYYAFVRVCVCFNIAKIFYRSSSHVFLNYTQNHKHLKF